MSAFQPTGGLQEVAYKAYPPAHIMILLGFEFDTEYDGDHSPQKTQGHTFNGGGNAVELPELTSMSSGVY